ncbi:MAG: MBL fold metallo-hydrolase [Saprospiraceae bacterium]|nr:MBL fold metallo-hydrolase [Candidatus Vicinibacter affinis]
MFNIYVIQALNGDSMIIEYNDTRNSKYILIDGGPRTIFANFLNQELKRLVGNKGTLETIMVSHVDDDHISGIIDLFTLLKEEKDNGVVLSYKINHLWHNTFPDTIDLDGSISSRLNNINSIFGQQGFSTVNSAFAVNSIIDGNKLTALANVLAIKINDHTNNRYFSLDNNTNPIIFDNLNFTIIGPSTENLKALNDKWKEWIEKQEEYINRNEINLASYSDRSVPNLSSLVFITEGNGKTVLFTGDARGDYVYEGLKKRKLLKYGKAHFDILKVPHHGSDRNVTREFFENITADQYIISADGKHGNPDYATLAWIVESAHMQQRNIEIFLTNKTDTINKFLKNYKMSEWGYKLTLIKKGKNSLKISL